MISAVFHHCRVLSGSACEGGVRRKLAIFLLLLVIVVGGRVLLWGQGETTSAIVGRVTDQTHRMASFPDCLAHSTRFPMTSTSR